MTLIVQDDAGTSAGANGYVDAVYFTTYHLDRGDETVADGTYTDADFEAAIILASDYLDHRYDYQGHRLTDSQTTEWPRSEVMDDGYFIEGIPERVKRATSEYARLALDNKLRPAALLDQRGQQVVRARQKVGSLEEEIEYHPDLSPKPPSHPKADALIRGYAVRSATARIIRS